MESKIYLIKGGLPTILRVELPVELRHAQTAKRSFEFRLGSINSRSHRGEVAIIGEKDEMDRRRVIEALVVLAAGSLSKGFGDSGAVSAQTTQAGVKDKVIKTMLEQALPAMDGADLEVTVLSIDYPPGSFSKPHRHPGAVFGYILQGSLQIQLEGERQATYTEGEIFYEPPGRAHLLGRNASSNQVAKLLAFHIGKRGEPITIPFEDR